MWTELLDERIQGEKLSGKLKKCAQSAPFLVESPEKEVQRLHLEHGSGAKAAAPHLLRGFLGRCPPAERVQTHPCPWDEHPRARSCQAGVGGRLAPACCASPALPSLTGAAVQLDEAAAGRADFPFPSQSRESVGDRSLQHHLQVWGCGSQILGACWCS